MDKQTPLAERSPVRYLWIDVAKALGIWLIYVGHITNLIPLVWRFHVPLFFFLSGCTEALCRENRFVSYFLNKCKRVLLPWLVFNLLSLVVHILLTGCGFREVMVYGYQILKGTIRNTGVAGALWFFTCLFVIQMLFFFIRKLKFRPLMLTLSVGICFGAGFYFDYNQPFAPYNVDSALHYIVYYAAGFVAFPLLQWLTGSRKGKPVIASTGLLAWVYTGLCYLGIDLLGTGYSIPHWGRLLSILSAGVMIYAFIALAWALQNVLFLQKLGKKPCIFAAVNTWSTSCWAASMPCLA